MDCEFAASDRIFLEGMTFMVHLGVSEEERAKTQDIAIDISWTFDTRRAGRSDALNDTICYHQVWLTLSDFLGASSFKLVEALAAEMTKLLFDKFPGMDTLRLKITKPRALEEFGVRAAGVSLERRRPRRALVALGSNLGDRLGYLRSALQALSERCQIVAVSSVYETEPAGNVDQGPYLNAVIALDDCLGPRALLSFLLSVESRLGRVREQVNGPRTLDLDLLAHGESISHDAFLELPHPRLHERAFVLEPLGEIAPDWIHPILGKNTSELNQGPLQGAISAKLGPLLQGITD